MKKIALLALLPLTLAACGIGGTPKGDVTGNISNIPSGQGTIRIAVLGVSFGGISNTSTDYLTVTPTDRGAYGAGLPSPTGTGAYRVAAYTDTDDSKTYNADKDKAITKDNGKLLVFIANDFSGDVIGGISGLAKGWNLVENGKLVKSGTPFNNYDLTF